jgi:hypothetical protein
LLHSVDEEASRLKIPGMQVNNMAITRTAAKR